MTESSQEEIVANVRLCISMHRHMTHLAHTIEQETKFKDAFKLKLPKPAGSSTPVATFPVQVPTRATTQSSGPRSLFAVLSEFHHSAKEADWISSINAALASLRTSDQRSLCVTAHSGQDGWCSPHPTRPVWEIIRTYELEAFLLPPLVAASGEETLPVTLFEAVEQYKSSMANDPRLREFRYQEALAILASTRIMAVLTVLVRD